jgi:hypothetical protein
MKTLHMLCLEYNVDTVNIEKYSVLTVNNYRTRNALCSGFRGTVSKALTRA